MPKQLVFHSDYIQVVAMVDGVPYAVAGEVDIVLKQPAKLPETDKRVWAKMAKDHPESLSVGGVLGVKA